MAVIKWEAPTAWADAIAGTALNALANGSSATGAEIDNSTNRDIYADLSFRSDVAGSINADAQAHIEVHVLARMDDDSTFADLTVGTLAAIMTIAPSSNNDKESAVLRVPIPPGRFKFAIVNRCGASGAFPASNSNVLKYRAYGEEV